MRLKLFTVLSYLQLYINSFHQIRIIFSSTTPQILIITRIIIAVLVTVDSDTGVTPVPNLRFNIVILCLDKLG